MFIPTIIKTCKISASGQAGPYGRDYSSWKITDKLGLGGDRGEIFESARTQWGEQVFEATIQGIYVKEGSLFKVYCLDVVSDGKLQIKVARANFFFEKTMEFGVADIC